jgi:anti-sigma factor RsiW
MLHPGIAAHRCALFLRAEEGMGHFDVAFWADFVRGIVGTDERAALEEHLASCQLCAANLRWLIEVTALTAADAQYEPPAELLARADAIFATANPHRPTGLPGVAPPPVEASSEPPSGAVTLDVITISSEGN